MGLAERLGLKRPSGEVRGNVIIGITPLGERKATHFELRGDMFQLVATANERGPSSITELAEALHKNPFKTQKLIEQAIARGYLKVEKIET